MKITQRYIFLIMLTIALPTHGSVSNVMYNVAYSLVDDTEQAWSSPMQVAFIPGTNKAYVTNQGTGSGFVSIVDTETDTVTGIVSVGSYPFNEPTSIAVTSDGATAFVGNVSGSEPRHVSIIDTASDTVVGYVIDESNYIGNPSCIVISADNSYAYITDEDNSYVVVVAITNNNPGGQTASVTTTIATNVTPYPSSIALVPNTSYACVVGDEGGPDYPFTILDTASDVVVYNIYNNANYYGYSVAVNPDGHYAYVANYYASLAIIDLQTKNIITTTVGTIQYPTFVLAAPNNSAVYVSNYNNGDTPTVTIVPVGGITPLGNVQDPHAYFIEGIGGSAINGTIQKMYTVSPSGSVIVILPLVAPTMTIEATKNQFLMQSIVTNIVRLQAPKIGITPEKFELYQNGVLIETVPYVADQAEYVIVIPYLQPATNYSYSIRSIDASGDSSLYNVVTVTSASVKNGQ